MFSSRTLVGHLARGAVGIASLGGALMAAPAHPVVALLALAFAVTAFRGCPACWTVGLIETVIALWGRRDARRCRECDLEDSP